MTRFEFSLENYATPANGLFAFIGLFLGPYIDFLYGPERQKFFWALFGVIMLDWATGISAAKKHNTYSSEYGLGGLFRMIIIFCFPAVANLLDEAMGTPGALFYAVVFGMLYHTWNSLTANAYRAGFGKYIPKKVLEHVGSEIEAKAKRAAKQKGAK